MNTSDNQTVELEPTEEMAEPPQGLGRRSPGAMLAAQRETLELSVQQVADQLNLTMHFVRALETDCYDKLPGEVFVRGYIRAYSNLLRLDPVQLLLIFDEFTSQKIARKEEAIKRRDRRRKDKNRPWILFSGFAFVAVAVALWYLNPPALENTVPSNAVTVAAPAMSVLSAVPLETPVSASVQAPSEQVIIDTPPDAVFSQEAESDRSMTGDELIDFDQELLVLNQPQIAALAPAVATGLEAVDGVIIAPSPDPVLTHTESVSAGSRTVTYNWTGSDELTLRFEADCWVEIEHRGGDEVYQNSSSAGDTLIIKGTAPFSVLLGNARNVDLTFNGRNMDISSNIRADNTARLSIGM